MAKSPLSDGLDGDQAWRDAGPCDGLVRFSVQCVRLVTCGQTLRSGDIGVLGDLDKELEAGMIGLPKSRPEFGGSVGRAELAARVRVEDVSRECCRGASDDA